MFDTIERQDGRWWIRCRSKRCGNQSAEMRPVGVAVGAGLEMEITYDVVCSACGGQVELHRVRGEITIEDKPENQND